MEKEYGIKLFTDDFLKITHTEDGVSRMLNPREPNEKDKEEVAAMVVAAEENADIHAFMKVIIRDLFSH